MKIRVLYYVPAFVLGCALGYLFMVAFDTYVAKFVAQETFYAESVWVGDQINQNKEESQRAAAQINQNEWDIYWLLTKPEPDYEAVLNCSVRVDVDGGCGSGVLVTRSFAGIIRTYVWTAAHVVYRLKNVDGTFRNATIYREIRVDGVYQDCERVKARVIAYSAEEDLALLEILKDDYPETYTSFYYGCVPLIGTKLMHVGSVVGLYNSVSLGIMSQTDRDIGGKRFDQTTVMGYPGSSGGGVYTLDGECIGLLTQGVGPGLNFIVPIRRMRAWAKEVGVEWALDHTVPVPLTRAPLTLEQAPVEESIEEESIVPVDIQDRRIKELI